METGKQKMHQSVFQCSVFFTDIGSLHWGASGKAGNGNVMETAWKRKLEMETGSGNKSKECTNQCFGAVFSSWDS